MSKTPVEIASFLIQIGLMVFGATRLMPRAQPQGIQTFFVVGSSVLALFCTWIGFAIGPGALPINPVYFSAALLAVAVAAPVAGVIEAKYTSSATPVYDRTRFLPHLLTNVAGACAAVAFIWAGRSTEGFDSFSEQFRSEAAFNIVLPMTVIVIFAFVRVQQVDKCHDLDKLVHDHDDSWRQLIAGYSLARWHQILNILYLIAATFAGATMVLYLFAYTMKQAQRGEALPYTWQFGMALIVLLAFLFSCAIPKTRRSLRAPGPKPDAGQDTEASGKQAVYLTFLTGTPAALVVALVWFALLRESPVRNGFAMGIVGGGYVLYTLLAVLGSRADGKDKVQLHYFSSAAFATVLIVLAGALYYS